MTSAPPLAAYSYDGVWFIAKVLDALVKDHAVNLEKVKTGNESFYQLLKSEIKSVTFFGLTVSKPKKELLTVRKECIVR